MSENQTKAPKPKASLNIGAFLLVFGFVWLVFDNFALALIFGFIFAGSAEVAQRTLNQSADDVDEDSQAID